jgi:arginyl-tRNA synthetase
MFDQEQQFVEAKINQYSIDHQIPQPRINWIPIPFSGQWGITTSFFQIASQSGRPGEKVNVPLRAQEIASAIAAELTNLPGIDRVEATKGYLNLYFSTPEFTQRVVDAVLNQGEQYGAGAPTGKKIMVEYSQPNTHKAFHVGHLRNVILGATVSNILEFAGYEVIRANYIGDIGLHVIKWMWNYQKVHKGELPPENITRWMGDLYAEADRRYNEEEGAQDEVKALFARWDQRDPEVVDLWKTTRQWSLDGFQGIYQEMGARFDKYYFPSEYEESGKELVKELIDKGIAKDERPENPVIVNLDELLGNKSEKLRVLVVLRSDGTSLYATEDLPLAIQKFKDYDLYRSVYVIDVRQSLYMQQIYKTLELMGYTWADRCYHLAYEIVNLPGNITMKSREGTVVLLEDLLREAKLRALAVVEHKNPTLTAEQKEEISHAVALGAIKYSMLFRDNTKIVTFDWDAALDVEGQASPYIQYAYVRANSILRKAGGEIPPSLQPTHALEPNEVVLIDLISRLPQEVQRAANEYKPMYIAALAFKLAQGFNDFYNSCPVIQAPEPVRESRLRLVAAARQAIHNCLALMGITAPEAM